ncbi:MAG: rod shape-determining protein MreD [Bacteroidaceae bacterium]|nr:rod shape-determining protein MreD [Bacteroidaceae bacterium]
MVLPFLFRLFLAAIICVTQIVVCNQMHLFGYATPMIATLFFCYLPQNANRIGNMIWAFLIGMVIDIFGGTPGENAASLTLAALIQWSLLRAMLPKDGLEDDSCHNLTSGRHFFYIVILATVHHVGFFALESFSMFHITDTAIALGSSLALSITLILALESLRKSGKQS